MKSLKWLLVPIVVLAGLTFAAPDRTEAARWRVYAGGPYPYHAHRYRAPRYYGWHAPVVAPVYPAPVIVAPRPYGVYYGPPRPVYPAPHYYVW